MTRGVVVAEALEAAEGSKVDSRRVSGSWEEKTKDIHGRDPEDPHHLIRFASHLTFFKKSHIIHPSNDILTWDRESEQSAFSGKVTPAVARRFFTEGRKGREGRQERTED